MVNKIIILLKKLVQCNDYNYHYKFTKWFELETLSIQYNNKYLDINLQSSKSSYSLKVNWENHIPFNCNYDSISEEEYLTIKLLFSQLKDKDRQYQQDLLDEFIESVNDACN